MKVMVLVKATKDSEAGVMPSEQLMREMGKFNEELVKAGVMLAGEGLHPTSKGARVLFSGKDRIVTDGPFAETKELVAGFWMWQVKSMQEAIEWVKRCPNPMNEDSEIEIRPVFEWDDFAAADPTGELREAEQRLREQVEGPTLKQPRFETHDEFVVAGLNGAYTLQTRATIPVQWDRFMAHIGKVPGQVGTLCYGVSWNFKPDCGFDYLTAVEVHETAGLPAEYTTLTIPKRRYAVFSHSGTVSQIDATIDAVWSRWLPTSGHQLAQSPMFERYLDDFNPQTGQGLEIWIPLAD